MYKTIAFHRELFFIRLHLFSAYEEIGTAGYANVNLHAEEVNVRLYAKK